MCTNACAAIWCKINMFIRNICKRIKIWRCTQIFKCEKSLHILPAFNPFSCPQKEYKRVLEWKISNLKLAWEESIFKTVSAIIHSKICNLLLTKEINVFVRPCKICRRIIFLNFFSFLRLRYSYNIRFSGGNCFPKLKSKKWNFAHEYK